MAQPNPVTPKTAPLRPYPLDVCIVSGTKLGAHGEPHVFEHKGQEIKLCCAGCLDAFQKEPERYLAKLQAPQSSCCHGGKHHAAADTAKAAETRKPGAKYFCPMCPGVESDAPGACPKCGMALERNPTWKAAAKTIYTCPMHPEIEQDHPGSCPKCGMALEPKTLTASGEEDDAELRDMTCRMRISAALPKPNAGFKARK